MQVFEANPQIVAELAERGLLLNKPGETVRHQYPCCWRCKNPIIFRATEQWFARLGDADDERRCATRALAEIGRHAVDPGLGREPHPRHDRGAPRLVPVAPARLGRAHPRLPLRRSCRNDLLVAPRLSSTWRRSSRARARTPGSRKPAAELLPPRHRAARGCGGHDFEKQHDIVDVWFESGVSWAAVAEGKLVPTGEKVDLYLEGSDQHRGWFHSSLLTSAATRGQAPYKAVLTHGWVLDERGKAYSKSEIAGRAPPAPRSTTSTRPSGWRRTAPSCCACGPRPPTTRGTSSSRRRSSTSCRESYRKIRNTCRYLLSNLYDFVPVARPAGGLRAARARPAGAGRAARARPPDLRGLPALRLPRGGAAGERLRHHRCRPSTSTRSRTPLYCEATGQPARGAASRRRSTR